MPVMAVRFRHILALASLALAAGCAAPPPAPGSGDYAAVERYLADYVPAAMRRHHVVGLSLALVDERGLIFAHGYGYADLAAGRRADADTVYRAGSLSKPLTATALMRWVAAGRVDLDRPYTDYVPEFVMRPRFAGTAAITPRQLLTHHAGLPTFRLQGFWQAVPMSQLVTQLADESPAYPPGEIYVYSNLGYDLLGRLLERISGRDFVPYMRSAVLDPLGMAHSDFAQSARVQPWFSQGYRDGAEYTEPREGRDLPAGGLHTSVRDLSRFVAALLAGGAPLLPDRRWLEAMYAPQNTGVALDLDQRVGLAWMLGNTRLRYAGRVVAHSGSTAVFRSRMILLPDQGLGVVVLANTASAGGVVNDVAVAALQQALAVRRGLLPPPAGDAPVAAAQPDRLEVGPLAGAYATAVGLLQVRDGWTGPRAEVLGLKFALREAAPGVWRPRLLIGGVLPWPWGRWERMTLTRARIDGHELLVATEAGQRRILGERLDSTPVPAVWCARFGDYRVEGSGAGDLPVQAISLGQRDGVPVLTVRIPDISMRRATRPLRILGPQQAALAGLGMGLGEVIEARRDAAGEYLYWSGLKLRRVSAGEPTP